MQNARNEQRAENARNARYEMENRMEGMENRNGRMENRYGRMENRYEGMENRYEMEGGMGMENRRRYEDGRFAPNNRYEGGTGMNMIGFNNEGGGFRSEYRGEQQYGGNRMEGRGGYPPEFERSPSSHYGGHYQAEFAVKPMDEMQSRGGSKMHGGAEPPEFNEKIARY